MTVNIPAERSKSIDPGQQNVVLFVGGVGGAKLALGLLRAMNPAHLTIVVNVGDDFRYYGLTICPDIDTMLYTLSGRVNTATGWGLHGDTATTLDALRDYGDDAWFWLGDRDLATHLLRTQWLAQGQTLTQVVGQLARRMGIAATVLPVTDQAVPTLIETETMGTLPFQEYFVRYRWQPAVRRIVYAGAPDASISAQVHRAIQSADRIVFGPSNPWLSIEPMLAIGDPACAAESARRAAHRRQPVRRWHGGQGAGCQAGRRVGAVDRRTDHRRFLRRQHQRTGVRRR